MHPAVILHVLHIMWLTQGTHHVVWCICCVMYASYILCRLLLNRFYDMQEGKGEFKPKVNDNYRSWLLTIFRCYMHKYMYTTSSSITMTTACEGLVMCM